MKKLKTFSCSISLRARDQSVSKAASIPIIIHMPGTFRCETKIGTAPCVSTLSLPDIMTHNQISQAFPLHICILEAVKD